MEKEKLKFFPKMPCLNGNPLSPGEQHHSDSGRGGCRGHRWRVRYPWWSYEWRSGHNGALTEFSFNVAGNNVDLHENRRPIIIEIRVVTSTCMQTG